VYPWKLRPGTLHDYEEDRSIAFPLHLLVFGRPYWIAGLIPSRTHLFGAGPEGNIFVLGTDEYGRDVFSRLLYGGRISLFTGLLAAGISVGWGVIAGTLAGYYGRWIDETIMRAAELFLAVPWLYLLLAIRAFLPLRLDPSEVFLLLIAVAGIIAWARPARLARGVVLAGREREYVLAAKGFGASDFYVLRTHVLPQAYRIAMMQARLYIPQYITAEIVLSFFGLGVGEPVPSWGNMLGRLQNLFVLESCWWMYSPAILLVAVLLLFEWLFRTV
jgi:peptide/nickel transport system permease protein